MVLGEGFVGDRQPAQGFMDSGCLAHTVSSPPGARRISCAGSSGRSILASKGGRRIPRLEVDLLIRGRAGLRPTVTSLFTVPGTTGRAFDVLPPRA